MRFLLLLLVLVATPAYAAFQGPAEGAPLGTVQQVLNSGTDDVKMCLEGNIISKVTTSNNKYNFQDTSGTIVVEIKEVVFGGQNVTPSNKVRICGEVDKERMKTNEFDAKYLHIIGQ